MLARTHLAIGLLTAAVLYPILQIKWYLFFPAVLLGSILPDIDHEGSKINQILPLTKHFAKLFRHRGFFHSAYPVIFFIVLEFLTNMSGIGFALAIGYASHLLSDGLTPVGVNLLHPAAKLKIEGFIPTGGAFEVVVFIFAAILSIAQVIALLL